MDNRELLVAIFSIAAGTFSIAASVFNWEFFFNSRKATLFMNLFGRNGARIFYTLLGLFLILLALSMFMKKN